MKIKVILLSLAIALIGQLFLLAPKAHAEAPGQKRMIMVSAYYSPLPDQRFYMRGSYAGDIRLNGRGTNGADGTEVYVGMLAAPRGYPFGIRIRIPGLGVGEVHDRGGAIRAYNNYDRIDVWMGYGEEGLSRALNWGMRLVEGEIYWKAHQVEPGLSFGWVSSALPKSTLSRLIGRTISTPKTFTKPITSQSPKGSVRELQEALRLFGYYNGPVTGNLGDRTKEAILAFQLAEGVVLNKNSAGAGYFGPKTRQALKTKLENFNSKVLKEQSRLKNNLAELTIGLGKNSTGDEVYRLQQMLWELGYYSGELNGKYASATIDAVFEFQKENGIIKTNWDKGAGYFGKKTHAALVAAVDRKVEKIKSQPVAMQAWVPAKISLPSFISFDKKVELEPSRSLKFDLAVSQPAKTFTKTLSMKDRGLDVVKLQNILIDKGYLAKGFNTGYFGTKTKDALVKFQIEEGIVKSSTDPGAGRAGSSTREVLNSL